MQKSKIKNQNYKSKFKIPREAGFRNFSLLPFFFSVARSRVRAGFTMVEVAIILGVIIMIASIVLVSFPNLSQNIALQRSARQLALSFRKIQNTTFASRETAAGIVPAGYGLYFNRAAAPGSYIIFADLRDATGVGNGRYDAAADVVVDTIRFESGVSIADLVSDLGGADQRQDVLNIVFQVPDARMSIKNDSIPAGESAEISLSGRAGLTRSVIVRTTGQVYVK